MADYRYSALRPDGRETRGRVSAEDERDAATKLEATHLHVLELSPLAERAWWGNYEITLSRKWPPDRLAVWSRQLATLIRAGVPIVQSLRIMSKQGETRSARKLMDAIIARVENGDPLSFALAEQGPTFPPLLIQMVRVGEVSGTMDETLERMAQYFETDHRNTERIKSALVYPLVVGLMSVAVTIFVMVRIVPTFVTAFVANGASLPWATRAVIAVSRFLIHDWWVVLGAVGVILTGDLLAKRRVRRYRLGRDGLLLKLPIIGVLQQKMIMAQFSRTMSLLMTSAVPIVEGVKVMRQVVNNDAVGATLQASAQDLEAGHRLSRSLMASPWVPPLVSEMVAIGEETGSLDVMLSKLADLYETEVNSMAERMQALLEPVMILILAAVVGLIVLAVLAPEFKLIQVIH